MAETVTALIGRCWADPRLRYLAVGGLNTVFGYVMGLGLYELLRQALGIVVIGVIVNVACITFSFVTYKLLVFRTRGGWLPEYLRCYLVYGAVMVLNVALLWLCVDKLGFPFWLAQGIAIPGAVAVSYLGHKWFTFKSFSRKALRESKPGDG